MRSMGPFRRDSRRHLLVKVADGSGLAKIAPPGIPGTFSADGKRMVFSVAEGDKHRLAIVNRDGTGFAKLGTEDADPVSGFHARRHASTTRSGTGWAFFDLDGTLLRTIPRPGGTINEARLSPDGKRFVFIDFVARTTTAAIATINVDGTDLQIVVPAIQGEDALHSEQSGARLAAVTAVSKAAGAVDELRTALADDAAFEAWYRRTVSTVYSYLLARCRSADLAEELTQETYAAAIARRNSYDGRSEATTWLCGIARHKLADHFRASQRGDRRRIGSRCARSRWLRRRTNPAGSMSRLR